MKFKTKAIHSGIKPDSETRSIVTPIYQTNIFSLDADKESHEFAYSRMNNPTRKILETNLAELEGGTHCNVFASGLAAETTILNMFEKGDHIICGNDVYGGTIRLINHFCKSYGLEVTYTPLDLYQNVEVAINNNTKAIWLETPSNPMLTVVDIKHVVKLARSHNLLVIVDNTLLTPYFQRPLELGADIVVHSASKYLSGHNDVTAGVVVTNKKEHGERIQFLSTALGPVAGPFDSWLILRGLKTLSIRMQSHEENAIKVAQFLKKDKRVKSVYYPGLAKQGDKRIIERQMSGYGGMVSFEVNPDLVDVKKVLKGTKLFYLAQSFGGVESIIEHPTTMSHKSMTPEEQNFAGITNELIRLSVGLEDADDLIADLDEALGSAAK